MFTETEIIAKAWMVKEQANLLLSKEGLSVCKIFLCGSYASGKANEDSDIDLIIQLNERIYPKNIWKTLDELSKKLNDPSVHIIFGTETVAKRLKMKHKGELKPYDYREITLHLISKEA